MMELTMKNAPAVRGLLVASTVLSMSALALPAAAVVIPWTSSLDQAQEIPVPVAVPGAAGSASGELDTDSGLLSWTVDFSGLSGPAVGIHFHGPAAPGATAGVQVNIGDISGLTSPSMGNAALTIDQISEFLDGMWYINIHTALNGPGEVRGQVIPQVANVPEPSTGFMLLAGLAGLGWLRMRR